MNFVVSGTEQAAGSGEMEEGREKRKDVNLLSNSLLPLKSCYSNLTNQAYAFNVTVEKKTQIMYMRSMWERQQSAGLLQNSVAAMGSGKSWEKCEWTLDVFR